MPDTDMRPRLPSSDGSSDGSGPVDVHPAPSPPPKSAGGASHPSHTHHSPVAEAEPPPCTGSQWCGCGCIDREMSDAEPPAQRAPLVVINGQARLTVTITVERDGVPIAHGVVDGKRRGEFFADGSLRLL